MNAGFHGRMSVAAALLALAGAALGSSHREAPGITKTPKVDATDFYMFNSYEPGREGFVTIIANYQPFQTEYGGPNFFTMDPDALYQIHVDNNGDAREDITFSFRFANQRRDLSLNIGGVIVPVPLVNIGPISANLMMNPNLNVVETYTLDVVRGDQYSGAASPAVAVGTNTRTFNKPADNIGAKSFPQGYESYSRSFITEFRLPGSTQTGRVFVGQRKDPFVVNLGETFDLINFNPLGPVNAKRNSLDDANVTSLVIEVPASYLRASSGETVIGGWTTASLPRVNLLGRKATSETPDYNAMPWTQVSRLGMPLVNEVVIGLRDKDKFNNSRPRSDGQFLRYVTNPTLPAIVQALFGVQAPCLPRNDLIAVFLTGVQGLNQPANVTPGEMLRLQTNTSASGGGIAVTPRGSQNPLGVIAGDLSGFPNGRRPGDDVVDVALRVVMGVLSPGAGQAGGCAPGGNLPLTDGAFVNDAMFGGAFPYLNTPVTSSPQLP